MYYTLFLIGALVIGSGFIAFLGDYLGKKLGKMRITIWGLRPKHTARLISMLSGVMILLLTLAVVSAVSEQARQGIFFVGQLRQRQAELQAKIDLQEKKLNDLRKEARASAEMADAYVHKAFQAQKHLKETRKMLAQAHQQLAQAQQQLAQAQHRFVQTLQALQRSQRQLAVSRQQLAAARQELRSLVAKAMSVSGIALDASAWLRERNRARLEKEELERHLTRLLTELKPVYHVEDVVASKVIPSAQGRDEVRHQLRALLEEAGQQAKQRGAGDRGGRAVVVAEKLVGGANAKTPRPVTEEESINAVVDSIRASEGESVLVELYAVRNTFEGEPVPVDFKLYRNRLLFRKGEIVARKRVDGRGKLSAVCLELAEMVQRQVREEAAQRGLMRRAENGSEPGYGSIRWADILEAAEAIRNTNAPVLVEACAKEDTYTAGPLLVEFRILPEGDKQVSAR